VNIYVCIKQVPDTEATILVKDGKTINEAAIKWIVSPYDEYAIEEALKLKEKVPGSTVTAVCLGPDRVQNALRTALAMGADHAMQVDCGVFLDNQNTAGIGHVLRADKEFGSFSWASRPSTTTPNQLHLLLAEALAIPVATNVMPSPSRTRRSRWKRRSTRGQGKDRNGNSLRSGCGQRLNTPRYASMMGIMKAKKIEDQEIALSETGSGRVPEQDPPAQAVGSGRKAARKGHPREPAAAVRSWPGCLREEARSSRRQPWPTLDCISMLKDGVFKKIEPRAAQPRSEGRPQGARRAFFARMPIPIWKN